MSDSSALNSSLKIKQAVQVLEYLEKNENKKVTKEQLYANIDGSRQTKIKVLKNIIDLKWAEVTSIGIHNTQTLALTNAGKEQLAMLRNQPLMNSIIRENEIKSNTYITATTNRNGDMPLEVKLSLIKMRSMVEYALTFLKEEDCDREEVIQVLKEVLGEIDKFR